MVRKVCTLALALAALSGCDWFGSSMQVVEEQSKQSANLKIVMQRLKQSAKTTEGYTLHYTALCRTQRLSNTIISGDDIVGGQYRVAEAFALQFPMDQLNVVNDDIGFGVLGTSFFGTTDGCKTSFTWRLQSLPAELAQLLAPLPLVSTQPFLLNPVYVPPGEFEFYINPYYIKDAKKIVVKSSYAQQRWDAYLENSDVRP